MTAEDGQRDDQRDGEQEDLHATPFETEDDTGRLDLDEGERLPWLESIDDDDDYDRADSSRLVTFLIGGLVVLAALVGGIWWATHRGEELQADGSVIVAPKTPYKEAPKDAGGKTFAGTGDTAYAVSEGQARAPKLDQSGQVIAPATDAAKPGAPATPAPSGVGVREYFLLALLGFAGPEALVAMAVLLLRLVWTATELLLAGLLLPLRPSP